MDWYQHSTSSHDDPDISDAMDKFGAAAYSVFFITLEIYGSEFNRQNSEHWLNISQTFLRRKLRISWTKGQQILDFFSERRRLIIKYDKNMVSINIPKFIDIASNWIKRPSPIPTEGLQCTYSVPTAIEEEEKKNKKKKKNNKEEENNIAQKKKFLDVVFLTDIELEKLIVKNGKELTDKAIEILNNAIMSKGYKYKSHYHTLIGWPLKEAKGGNNGNKQTAGKYQGGFRTGRELSPEANEAADKINEEYYRNKANADSRAKKNS